MALVHLLIFQLLCFQALSHSGVDAQRSQNQPDPQNLQDVQDSQVLGAADEKPDSSSTLTSRIVGSYPQQLVSPQDEADDIPEKTELAENKHVADRVISSASFTDPAVEIVLITPTSKEHQQPEPSEEHTRSDRRAHYVSDDDKPWYESFLDFFRTSSSKHRHSRSEKSHPLSNPPSPSSSRDTFNPRWYESFFKNIGKEPQLMYSLQSMPTRHLRSSDKENEIEAIPEEDVRYYDQLMDETEARGKRSSADSDSLLLAYLREMLSKTREMNKSLFDSVDVDPEVEDTYDDMADQSGDEEELTPQSTEPHNESEESEELLEDATGARMLMTKTTNDAPNDRDKRDVNEVDREVDEFSGYPRPFDERRQKSKVFLRKFRILLSRIGFTAFESLLGGISAEMQPLKQVIGFQQLSMIRSREVYTRLEKYIEIMRVRMYRMRFMMIRSLAILFREIFRLRRNIKVCKTPRLQPGPIGPDGEMNHLKNELKKRIARYDILINIQLREIAYLMRQRRNLKNCTLIDEPVIVNVTDRSGFEFDDARLVNVRALLIAMLRLARQSSRAMRPIYPNVGRPLDRMGESRDLFESEAWKQLILRAMLINKSARNPYLGQIIDRYGRPQVEHTTRRSKQDVVRLANVLRLLVRSNLNSPKRKSPLLAIMRLALNDDATPLANRKRLISVLNVILKKQLGAGKDRQKMINILRMLKTRGGRLPQPKHKRQAVALLKRIFCSELPTEADASIN